MPVDERTFVADVKAWIDAICARRTDLPYERASVEEHSVGGQQRLDLVIYKRGAGGVALTGEVKMPDSTAGRRGPLDGELVEDAFEKASRRGSPYYFTWNVRDFVLFETHRDGVPFMDRRIEGPRRICEAGISDDVRMPQMQEAISAGWEGILARLNALESGARLLELPLDRRFVLRVESSLEYPITVNLDALRLRYAGDSDFRARLNEWMRETHGWEISEETSLLLSNLQRATRLSCYALLTRLVFYEVLRRRFRNLPALAGLQPQTPDQLAEALSRRFLEAIDVSRDYETVFRSADFGAGLTFLAIDSPAAWQHVFRDIEEFDFSRLDYDVIGRLYEQLIGPQERRTYGQFYTSPEVVDLINAFCIRSPDAVVLDPACGGGTFIVRAYARKRALSARLGTPKTHQRLLEEIFGVDIAAFPAQLSTINLAVRHLTDEPNYPRVVQRDFFDVSRRQPFMSLPGSDAAFHEVALVEIDAVVGNPPYIRHEEIGADRKGRIQRLVGSDWRGAGPINLSGRSDIYAYFFGHAGALVRPGGYLGLVTSVGWLDTEYGFRLQEFFLSNFRIVAVIESQVEKWFEDARVTTAVTILQREPDEEARRRNLVPFIQLRKPLGEIYSQVLRGPVSEADELARQSDMDAIRDLIEEIAEDEATDYWRVRVKSQGDLWQAGVRLRLNDVEVEAPAVVYRAGKWGQYLRAPDVWFELLNRVGPRMVPLFELAEVRFGFKTGVDRFFCVRDVTVRELAGFPDPIAFRRRYGISPEDTEDIRIVRDGEGGVHLVESRFLEPEFHTLMEARGIVIRASDCGRLVINAPFAPAALRGTHFEAYVRLAEQRGWHRGATVRSRGQSGPWYDLRLRPAAARGTMFWPLAQQYRHLVPWNEDHLPANHRLFDVWPQPEVSPRILWAVLNSTVVALSKHQFGRPAGIEGNLDTEVIDAKMMLVPDTRNADPAVAARLLAAAEAMAARTSARFLYEEFDLADRLALDDATLELLGVDNAAERARLRSGIYDALREQYGATRAREIVAQRHRSRANRGGLSPADMAAEVWQEVSPALNLLEFPRDFVNRAATLSRFDLPSGQIEVGTAMMETGRHLRAGTVRVGGPTGIVIEVGSVGRARFLQAASECGLYGPVSVPDEDSAAAAVTQFQRYKAELEARFRAAANERTRDPGRQRAIVAGLMRSALIWRHSA